MVELIFSLTFPTTYNEYFPISRDVTATSYKLKEEEIGTLAMSDANHIKGT